MGKRRYEDDPRFPKKENEPASIWDDDVDMEKVKNLTPKERHKFFPNDYAPDGQPYGDF